jgi:hypothetical protein
MVIKMNPSFVVAPQGSKEWHEARAGLITASRFAECRGVLKSGKNKGVYSSIVDKYAFKLACERITGDLLDCPEFTGWQAKRGNELEPQARDRHELEIGNFVDEVGLAISECGNYGSSVDGLIGDDGISEYKCFLDPLKIKDITLNRSTDTVMDQVQGGLWITGRKYAHFCLYCPQLEKLGLDFQLIKIERDEEYIEELKCDLDKFNKYVNKYVDKLREIKNA